MPGSLGRRGGTIPEVLVYRQFCLIASFPCMVGRVRLRWRTELSGE